MNKTKELSVLISESVKADIYDKKEIKDTTGHEVYRFKTPLNNTSEKTANGNLFTKDLLLKGFNKEGFQSRLKNLSLTGEFEHPTRDNPERYVQVYDSKVSHRFLKFWFDGTLLMCEAETTGWGKGKELFVKIASNSVPAFSLRAAGKVRQTPAGKKERDFRIITWDQVFMPSVTEAWVDKGSSKVTSPSKANEEAKRLFLECEVDDIEGTFKDVDSDLSLIAASFSGFKPDKTRLVKTNNGGVIGYYSESFTATKPVKDNLTNEINEFMKSV